MIFTNCTDPSDSGSGTSWVPVLLFVFLQEIAMLIQVFVLDYPLPSASVQLCGTLSHLLGRRQKQPRQKKTAGRRPRHSCHRHCDGPAGGVFRHALHAKGLSQRYGRIQRFFLDGTRCRRRRRCHPSLQNSHQGRNRKGHQGCHEKL